jgi:hypothetical protein
MRDSIVIYYIFNTKEKAEPVKDFR